MKERDKTQESIEQGEATTQCTERKYREENESNPARRYEIRKRIEFQSSFPRPSNSIRTFPFIESRPPIRRTPESICAKIKNRNQRRRELFFAVAVRVTRSRDRRTKPPRDSLSFNQRNNASAILAKLVRASAKFPRDKSSIGAGLYKTSWRENQALGI